MERKVKITRTYEEWEAVLTHMQEVHDPYFMKSWLEDVLSRHSPSDYSITLPAYGASADFLIDILTRHEALASL